MYPNTPTETEELIALIKSQSPKTVDIIKSYIDNHDTSKMREGIRYYANESDITKRKMFTYENDVKVIDLDATNNKLTAGWHKTLVDQKVAYLAGDPVSINSKVDNDPALEQINEILGEEFDDVLPELIKSASNKGLEWLHPYVTESGEFDYMIIPAEEAIPIYDNTKRKNLIAFIRFYELDDGTKKIEFWDEQQVSFYEETEHGINLDMSYEENPQSHFYYKDQGFGWSTDKVRKVPFIKFQNNQEERSDLTFYKTLIDAFEIVLSDVNNTLEDVQSFIYVLKGYEGTNLDEFMSELKKYKVIKTDGESGSGVDTLRAEIPVEAVESHLKQLTELIYQSGQGVDVSSDKFGNNPTGVSLKFLYSFLDMKASVLERKFSRGLRELMWFVCEYIAITENTVLNYKDYDFTFNKAMITNELEQVQMAQQSVGIVSKETILANHPHVTDPQAEIERLDQQQERELEAYKRNLEPLGGEEVESTRD